MSETEKRDLAAEWNRLLTEADKVRNRNGDLRIAESYETSAARIENRFQRYDIDPRDYLT